MIRRYRGKASWACDRGICEPWQRDGTRYAYRLTDKGAKIALLFVLFHQRLCGPLANSLFHHPPDAKSSTQEQARSHRAQG